MAFASLALADITVTVTQTLTYNSVGYDYTTISESTYTTADPTSSSAPTITSASESTSSSVPTSTSATTTHSIQVGPSGQLVYSPSNISANVGDTVAFFFNPKNHTVTQSSFAKPCERLEASAGNVALDSGFIPTTASLTTVGYSFVVNDTTSPLWFYCRQIGHCSKGMVFAVNANENRTFAAFQANAESSNTSSTSPTPSASSGGSTGSATGTGSSASSTSSSSSQTDNGAISNPVNFGLTAVLAVIGGTILVL